jgi:hypothetical protein
MCILKVRTKLKSMSKVVHRTFLTVFLVALLLVAGGFSVASPKADATTMTQTSVVETNMVTGASANSNLFIEFKAGAADASTAPITVTFPLGFTLATSTITTNNTTCAAFFGNSPTPLGLASTTVTESGTGPSTLTTANPSGALTSGTLYCTYISAPSGVITTNAAAGTYTVSIAANTGGSDTQSQGIDVVASASNQIAVTATIAQSFTLTLGGTTDTINNPSASNYASSTGVNLTASTNAASGWGIWVEDTQNGLFNAAHTIPAGNVTTATDFHNSSTSIGHELYGVTIGTVTGNAAAAANYTGTTNLYNGGPISSTTWNEVATGSTAASGTAKLQELLDIAPSTNQAAYTDTINVIGAGSF